MNLTRGFQKIFAVLFKHDLNNSYITPSYDEFLERFLQEHPVQFFFIYYMPTKSWQFQERFDHYVFSKYRYCINRFINRTHVIKTGLPKGQRGLDLSNGLLHGSFSLLVDIVERDIPNTWMYGVDSRRLRQYGYNIWQTTPFTRDIMWRKPEFGRAILERRLNVLRRTSSGEPDNRIMHELYIWWKFIRPARVDCDEASGMVKFIDDIIQKYGEEWEFNDLTHEEHVELRAVQAASDAQYKAYREEDNLMLARLIKHREDLYL